jgi:hypothetical protein
VVEDNENREETSCSRREGGKLKKKNRNKIQRKKERRNISQCIGSKATPVTDRGGL